MSEQVERSVEHVELRRGGYYDSVALMQVSRTVAAVDGVIAAQVAMGTDLNLDVLAAMGFTLPDGTGPNDLIVALRAAGEAAIAAATAAVEAALAPSARPASGSLGAAPAVMPRTTGSAARGSSAVLALISVPGQHAFTEAIDALDAGLNVMVFSDNVTVAQEVRLKEEAARRELLVMGPDCGTAVVSGVGLGFANVVRPGPVGLVAASGTGAQQVLCLLDGAGVGVAHCLGVGGRDLSTAVAGRSTLQALAMLDADPAVELIVLVSKPPAPEVEAAVTEFAATLSTPVQLALLGAGRPDLTAAASAAVTAVGGTWTEPAHWPGPAVKVAPGSVLRGAFSGGTLCDEAMQVTSRVLGPITSNIPLAGAPPLPADLAAPPGVLTHVMVDFGDDELTRGRPHPMIDMSLRVDWILRQARDGDVGVLLLDVVLGHGAHADPAAELAPALTQARQIAADGGRELAVVVSLCGTTGDPQGLERQASALRSAGAWVYLSNAAASRVAITLLTEDVLA